MKIFVDCPESLKKALEAVVGMYISDKHEIVQERIVAHLVITDTKEKVLRGYESNQYYILITTKAEEVLPINVRWVNFTNALVEIFDYISEISPKCEDRLQVGVEFQKKGDSSPSTIHVLVIDDKVENLKKALEQLEDKCALTLASGYDMGMSLLSKNRYDVVLTDCQMPIGSHHDAISSDLLGGVTIVHNGILLIFTATLTGARCAVVTDAGHHQDWVSASFDDFRNQQHTVNGQKVLFFNQIGKDWERALSELLK